jgi:hypothetical protein
MPVVDDSSAKRLLKASRPPAEAPMPTTGNEQVAAGAEAE